MTSLSFTFPASLVSLGSANGMVFSVGASDTWAKHPVRAAWSWTPGFYVAPRCTLSNLPAYDCMIPVSSLYSEILHWRVAGAQGSVKAALVSPASGDIMIASPIFIVSICHMHSFDTFPRFLP